MKSKIENFLILFNKLQRETNNSPANLEWLINEKPSLSDLCWDLNYQYNEIARLLIMKPKKHTTVPPVFPKKWDEYKKYWETEVSKGAKFESELFSKYLYEEWRNQFEEKLLANGKIPEEIYREEGKTPEELYQNAWKHLYDENDPDYKERLDPLEDNPAAIMDKLYDYLFNLLDIDDDFFNGIINNKHLEAWEFFTGSIGIDYSIIYSRWQNAPELFIPSHMEGRSNITSIEELYNEAVRAYVFGLTEASVAMCRALMEHVLKRYYRIPGDDLSKVISEAERRHRNLRELNLHSKRELANKVLHDYKNRGEYIEKAAFDFLQTIRHLVTNIPSP